MTYLYLKTKSCVAFNALGYLIRLLSYDAFPVLVLLSLVFFASGVGAQRLVQPIPRCVKNRDFS